MCVAVVCGPVVLLSWQIVNFVGVQGEVHEETHDRDFRERLRKIPLPDELMKDDNEDAGDEM